MAGTIYLGGGGSAADEAELWRAMLPAGRNLLFVGGGNTFDLLEQVRTCGFLDGVRDFVADGGDYYGGSAGAILSCSDIRIAALLDPNDTGLSHLDALGLVEDVAVLPHYSPAQAALAQDWSQRHGVTVIGVPEQAGLVVRAGETTSVGRPVAYFPA